MIRKLLLAVALLPAFIKLHAQYNLPQSFIWAMGNKVGLDFSNSSAPRPIATNLQNANEAAASICDTGGRLLFYTNGTVIWNAAGGQMPNGASLIGLGGSTRSTTQGAAIVPVPDSPGKYYVFSLTEGSNCRLFCNKIDMSLDGGHGDVDLSFPLRGSALNSVGLTEKMSVVPGCNNSVWLVVHVQNSNDFWAYHITSAGVNLTPVVSTAGNFPGGHYQQGVIKFSPMRDRLLNCNFRATAATNAGVEVFDFDYTTGAVSNAVLLDSGSHYGGAFSPDGSKVYAGSTAVMNTGSIAQWDLDAANPKTSKTVLGPAGQYTDMKLGPDGKIYFGALAGGAGYNNYRYMGRINAPDQAGTACGFKDSVSSLIFPHATNPNAGILAQGLPNDVAVPVPGSLLTRRALDTTICRPLGTFSLRAPAGYPIQVWDNGDSTLNRDIRSRGIYWVRSVSACDVRVDTFIFRGADMPAISITRNGPALQATAGFQSYQWYRNGAGIPGATTASYTITTNGKYEVRGIYGSGCSDSTFINITNAAGLETSPPAARIRIYPQPANGLLHIESPVPTQAVLSNLDGRAILRCAAAAGINTSSLPAGTYILRLTDESGTRLMPERLIQVLH